MALGWRIAKKRHPVYDGTGAMLVGGRWNSSGHAVIYAADSFAGALLEILVHTLRPRTLPGAHHAASLDIPDDLVEILDPEGLPGWEEKGSIEALRFGDRWLEERRSAVLAVPSVAARPFGRTILINPRHANADRITVSDVFDVPWDERLF